MSSEKRPLRILMVLEAAYPAEQGGGAEAQVRTLSRALRARGQRVTVLCMRREWGPQERVSTVDRVPVCRLAYPRIPLLAGPFCWLALLFFLYSRRGRYDVWHVHIAHRLAAVCALVAPWWRARVLTKVSGWWELEKGTLAPDARPVNRVAGLLLRRTAKWQAISRRIGSTLVARGIPESRIAYLPNAVDTERFAGMRRVPDAPPRFIFIGRLEAEKGHSTLLGAFSDINAAHPLATLLLVGTGSMEDQLKAEAERLGVARNVIFAGHRDDIETLLAEANIGLLCSRIEGLSNAMLECMASGLPMVASRISGNEDFVRHGENGWLFDYGDRAQLAQCLATAASLAPQQRIAMGEAALETVRRQSGLDQVLGKLMHLYRGEAHELATAAVSERSA
jgi:glycosyltransferase involved in cell wall biosynthesis